MQRQTPRPRAALACALTFGLAALAEAQIPQTFTNLQLHPKDISRVELVSVMRGFAGALGVRCNHCHVGPDNLEGMDFATDEKEAKRIARTMIQMVRTLNADFIARVPQREGGRQQVSCLTCHRSASRPPRPLEEILYETVRAQGLTAALKRYQELRDQFHGSGLYEANLGHHPKSLIALLNAGQIALAQGDSSAAQSYFRRALEIQPDNPAALKGLEAASKAR